MNLTHLFPSSHIFLDVQVANRDELFAFLSGRAGELGLANTRLCTKALHIREELGSTGLGNGIAIPHARIEGLEAVAGMLATLAKPIDFEAVDQEPVDVVMMLLMPEQSAGEPLKALSRIAKFARDEAAVNALRRAASVDAAVGIIEGGDGGR